MDTPTRRTVLDLRLSFLEFEVEFFKELLGVLLVQNLPDGSLREKEREREKEK